MRLFIAVWPPQPVLALLDAIVGDGIDTEAAEVRWTRPEQRHITLRFFGDVDEADASSIGPCLDDALRARPGTGAGAVEARLGPRVQRLGTGAIVVPVNGLDALASDVLRATSAFGSAPVERTFRGHLTLGRARRGRRVSSRALGRAIDASWVVEDITLIHSVLGGGPPRYEPLWRGDLGRTH